MCGILGQVFKERQPAAVVSTIGTALQSLSHRGPDAEGIVYHTGSGFHHWRPGQASNDHLVELVFAHKRLSIIDLTDAANQPFLSPDGRYCLTYNGEIYNYIELRDKLRACGHQFSTNSDTEVLLHAYMEWGEASLSMLTGMFAFALYDSLEKTVLLARDPFGIKPLYYTQSANGLAFSSEIGTLLGVADGPPRLNVQKAFDYLTYGALDADSETLFANIKQLKPASFLRFDLGSNSLSNENTYWAPDPRATCNLSFEQAAGKLRELMLGSVEQHLRSDVTVGAALSGGIDSSSVVSMIRHLYPQRDIHTFSYIADSHELSEESWVDRVTQLKNCSSLKTYLQPEMLVEELENLIRVQAEPFASTSIYAQYAVFRLAREQGIKVTLDGQGADELFAGYDSVQGYRLASLLAQGRPVEAWRFARSSAQWPNRRFGKTLNRAIYSLAPGQLVSLGRRLIGEAEVPPWLDKHWVMENDIDVKVIAARSPTVSRQHLKNQQIYQLTRFGLPGLLRFADRSSMHFSVESRVPFLTTELAEFALSLPEEYLIDNSGCSKAILREAMHGIVPDDILYRRDKIGFATPEAQWLSQISHWVERTLEDSADVPFLDTAYLLAHWEKCRLSGRLEPQIWRWINFIKWMQLFSPAM